MIMRIRSGVQSPLWEEADGLHGTFIVRESALGDEALADIMDGYLPACSVGFKPTTVGRGQQGETIVMAGDLREVSLLPIGAYDSAKVLALRRPTDRPGVWMPRPVSAARAAVPSGTAARASSTLRSAESNDSAGPRWTAPVRGKLGTLKL